MLSEAPRSIPLSEQYPQEEEIHSAIKELEMPLQTIIAQLQDRIRSGVYGLIVGDDASGRVPALALGGLIADVYHQNNHAAPDIRFFAGSTNLYTNKLREKKIHAIAEKLRGAMQGIQKEGATGRRVLFVTETIAMGESVSLFARACKEADVSFDIAAAHISSVFKRHFFGGDFAEVISPDTSIAYVSTGGPVMKIRSHPELSGVIKSPKDVFSRPLKQEDWDRIGKPGKKFDGSSVKRARQDIKVLEKHLLSYWGALPEENKKAAHLYGELASLRDAMINYKNLLAAQGINENYLYELFIKNGYEEKLRNFGEIYEQCRDNPTFVAFLQVKSHREREIFELLYGVYRILMSGPVDMDDIFT